MNPSSPFFHVEYEDNHLLIVNKKSGVLVQGDETGDIPLSEHVKNFLKEKYQKPGNVFAGVVHRLDRPVSGLVALARTSKALERMNKIFRERQVKKVYWAIVKKRPELEEGTLIHWLIKDTARNVTSAFNKEKPGAQKSELSYKILGRVKDHYLLEVIPVTGRPHQIRVQLATMGSPIVGDVKYGFREPNSDGSICLHARQLTFIHPVKKELITITGSLQENSFWNDFAGFHK